MRKKKRYMVILLVILFVIGIYIQQKVTHDLQVEGTAAGKEIVVYQILFLLKRIRYVCPIYSESVTHGGAGLTSADDRITGCHRCGNSDEISHGYI